MSINDAREKAWFAFQSRLGNLTVREEAMVERAFMSGWRAAVGHCGEQLHELLEERRQEAASSS